jgi:hypothetical protein
VSALLIADILRSLTGERLPGVIGALVLLAQPYVVYWAPLYRVDALALACSLGALCVIVRRPERASALCLCAALLTAAVFTRQSYVLAAPFAAIVWLATRPDGRRRAIGLVVLLGATIGGLLLALTLLTAGGFALHTITANVNEFHSSRLWSYLREFASLVPAFLLILVAYAALGRRLDAPSWRFLTAYAVGAALAGFTIGKVGSNVNYFLEVCAAASLATGLAWAGLRLRPVARNTLALVLLLQVSVLLGGTRYREHVRWKLQQRPAHERLMELLQSTEGTVLADETLGLLPLAGHAVYFQPFEMTQLARCGVWDPEPFLVELDRRAFALVLIDKVPWAPVHRTRWTPEMLDRLERGYDVEGVVGQTVIYRPRDF